MPLEAGGQLSGVSSLPPTDSIDGTQTNQPWQQVPVYTEPSLRTLIILTDSLPSPNPTEVLKIQNLFHCDHVSGYLTAIKGRQRGVAHCV